MSALDDPRVFFAAERTLLAWNRTSLTLMAFGFVIERFGLVMRVVLPAAAPEGARYSFWIGLAFILLGAYTSVLSTLQFRRVLRTLKPVEIPDGYRASAGVVVNLCVAALGVLLAVHLLFDGAR